MEDVNLMRLSPLRPGGGSLKSPSGKSTPRGSPSFRRLNSGRTPRKEGRSSVFSSHLFRGNRIILWLLLITLWAYAGFYFQSRWAHGDNKEDLFSGGYGGESTGENSSRRDLSAKVESGDNKLQNSANKLSLKSDMILAKNRSNDRLKSKSPSTKTRSRRSRRRRASSRLKAVKEDVETEVEVPEEEIPKQNTTYGLLVGPFGSIEDTILDWSPERRSGTCDRKGAFARLVWSRKFVLIFHELSMTGAPLAMMELASEFMSCGATIWAIVLNKKGGLKGELARRKIKVLDDKKELSFKTAMKADLIIAGSAVCSSWIEQYLSRTVLGSSQIMWWIMENRREYFDRSKLVLHRVKKLIFLSELQSKQWQAWCKEENIQLTSDPALLPLSVNDELAFVAGIPCSLNTPSFTTENMLEKRELLRRAVREAMGLNENNMLVITLSSINPGKGQLMLLESARLMIEKQMLMHNFGVNDSILVEHDYYSRALLQNQETDSGSSNQLGSFRKKRIRLPRIINLRNVLSDSNEKKDKNIKFLIGSVGSKSNKVPYVKALLRYLKMHSNLSNSVLWTPATTRVASLYAAADVYLMNSQGLGETFGRVTIEAMAFGLPVVGTDAGGTKEIVEHNVTGLLHPLGRPGAQVLANNLEYLLQNPSARQELGRKGQMKVEKMYLKKHMYQKFGEILYKCMRVK